MDLINHCLAETTSPWWISSRLMYYPSWFKASSLNRREPYCLTVSTIETKSLRTFKKQGNALIWICTDVTKKLSKCIEVWQLIVIQVYCFWGKGSLKLVAKYVMPLFLDSFIHWFWVGPDFGFFDKLKLFFPGNCTKTSKVVIHFPT